MALTKEQHATRRNHLGSTDVIKILDGHARDVYLSKVYEVEQGEDSPAAALGHALEPMLVDWLQDQLGQGHVKRQVPVSIPGTPVATVLDGLTISNVPVNAKTSGLAWEPVASQFGDPDDGNVAVPDRVRSQLHIEMACVEATFGHTCDVALLPVLIPRRLRTLYRVEREDGLVESLLTLIRTFWDTYVVTRTEPGPEWANVTGHELFSPSLELLSRIKRQPGLVLELPDVGDRLEQLEIAKDRERDYGGRVKKLKAELIALLGDAEAGRLPDGRIIEYMPVNRRGYTVEPTTYRQLKIRES